jgi:DivIVA domain-containing protein
MIPITARSDPARFRVRWRGYDRAEVDEFLRQTAADRQRLQEDLAQLEAVMASYGGEHRRELERLAAVRAGVESCLEMSISALRIATEQLSSAPQSAPGLPAGPRQVSSPDARWAWFHLKRRVWRLPGWMSTAPRRLRIGALSAAALIPVVLMVYYQSRAAERPAVRVVARQEAPRSVAPLPPVIAQVEGLVLAITARGLCWIRTTIDGGQPLERLLKPNETIMLRANEEAVLRVGDAAALSVTINNHPAKPFGPPGQVVTTRITRSNYLEFLSAN